MRGRKRIKSLIKHLIIVLFSVFLLSIALTFLFLWKYQDELKNYSVQQINEMVDTKIFVEQINISLLKSFPYVSVVLFRVNVSPSASFNSVQPAPDKLFVAENVFILFNPFDLILSKIEISKIYAVNGSFNLMVNSSGNSNALVLKSENNTKPVHLLDLNIKSLRLNDFRINYVNREKDIEFNAVLDNILLKAEYKNSMLFAGLRGNLTLLNFQNQDVLLSETKELDFKADLNKIDELLNLKMAEISLNSVNIISKGNISLGKNKKIDLFVESRKINISDLAEIIPEKIIPVVPLAEIDGFMNTAIKIQGEYNTSVSPSIKMVWMLKINKLPVKNEIFKNIVGKGRFSKPAGVKFSNAEIIANELAYEDNNSRLKGNLSIHNFADPLINVNLQGALEAKKLFPLIDDQTILIKKGMIYPEISSTFKIKEGNDRKKSTQLIDLKGLITLDDIVLSFDNYPESISLQGKSRIQNQTINSSLKVVENGELMDLYIQLKPVSANWRKLSISGSLECTELNLDFLSAFSNKENSSFHVEKLFPENIYGKLDFSFGKISYNSHLFNNLKGVVTYNPDRLDFSGLSFTYCEGNVFSDISMTENNSCLNIRTSNSLDKLDVSELFRCSNNFAQTTLTSKNLKGKISGNVIVNAAIDSNRVIKQNLLYSMADIKVESGELINFMPLHRLSGFVDIKELEKIRFSELENTFTLKKGQLSFPDMKIQSNAFDINVSGLHNLNGYFNYKVKILLSELLSARQKKKKSEFYIEEDNRRTAVYLDISGNEKDYKIQYDTKKAASSIKADLHKEKKLIKNIFKKEFGFGRKDTIKPDKSQLKDKFIIEFDEDTGKIKKQEK